LQGVYGEIKDLGANLVAISPQLQKYSKQMKKKHDLKFDILSDEGNKMAEKFGLKYQYPDYLIEVYKGFGLDFERFNGDDSWTLPMSSRYVVGKDGIIVAADFDPDYKKRPEPAKTIEDLKVIGG
jgi:peroxiredoxin